MTEPKIGPLSLLQSAGTAAAKTDSWTRMNLAHVPRFDGESVPHPWPRLHAGQGDFEPPARGSPLLEGWASYHCGDFERAAGIGLQHGGREGLALANRATAIYANYLEPREAVRLALFRQA